MSGGVVFRETLGVVLRCGLAPEAERDLIIALERGRVALPALYTLACAPALPREVTLRRAAAGYLVHCTGNLADDLADGDCNYFTELPQIAPVVQFALHSLLVVACVEGELAPRVIADASRRLAVAASLGSFELRQKGWDGTRYRRLVDAIAGEQWVAILLLLWGGTPLEQEAARVGPLLGIAGLVLSDLRSKDSRFFSMPAADQAEVAAWTDTAIDTLLRSPTTQVHLLGTMMQQQLQEARQ